MPGFHSGGWPQNGQRTGIQDLALSRKKTTDFPGLGADGIWLGYDGIGWKRGWNCNRSDQLEGQKAGMIKQPSKVGDVAVSIGRSHEFRGYTGYTMMVMLVGERNLWGISRLILQISQFRGVNSARRCCLRCNPTQPRGVKCCLWILGPAAWQACD